ncbi:PAS domain S-box protein [Desulfobacterales bacterium HSG17]|nr:PAS domain S-box protein [Desulfobacterales bacterium HSG17]
MSAFAQLSNELERPTIIADHNGIIKKTNLAFEKAFGWKNSFLLGKLISTIIPEGFRDAHNLGFSRFFLEGKPKLLNQPLTLKILKADGTVIDAEHYIIAEKQNDKWVFGAYICPLQKK